MLVFVLWRLRASPRRRHPTRLWMCRTARGPPTRSPGRQKTAWSPVSAMAASILTAPSREQTAVILYNYAHSKGLATSARAPTSRRSRMPAACLAGRRMRSPGPMPPASSRHGARHADDPRPAGQCLARTGRHDPHGLRRARGQRLILFSQYPRRMGRHAAPLFNFFAYGHLKDAMQKKMEFRKFAVDISPRSFILKPSRSFFTRSEL